MARILSQRSATQPGRPGFRSLSPGPSSGKSTVRRLSKRDPADGILGPGGDNWSDNEDIVGNPTPSVLGRSVSSGPSTKGKVVVADRSVDRRVNKR